MMSDEVRDCIERPEGQFFDRKSARIQPRELARHLIAFANADGGTIVLGLEDDGRITGLGPYAGKENGLLQAGLDFCEPPARVEHEYLSCTNATGEQDRLLVLTVRQSDRLHARTDDRVFLRVGDQSREMNFDERLELRYDKGDTHYEAVAVPDATLMHLFPNISDRTASADLMGLVRLKLLHRVGRTVGTYYHSGGIVYKLPNEV